MNHSPARILQQYLIDQDIGVAPPSTADWVCYVASMPELGDNALCLYDSSGGRIEGRSRPRLHHASKTVEHGNVTVRVRATNYETGRTKADSICDAFDSALRESVTIDGTDYLIQAITRTTSVKHLAVELNNRRQIFEVGFLVTVGEQ